MIDYQIVMALDLGQSVYGFDMSIFLSADCCEGVLVWGDTAFDFAEEVQMARGQFVEEARMVGNVFVEET